MVLSALIHYQSVTTYKNYYRGGSADILFDYAKPISLFWQFDAEMDLKYTFLRAGNENSQSGNLTGNLHEYAGYLSGKLGYYPNSRSYLSGILSLNISKVYSTFLFQPSNPQNTGNRLDITPGFSLAGYYYISAQLRLQAKYSLVYNNSKMHDNYNPIYFNTDTYGYKLLQQNIAITLTYSLF